MQITKAFGRMLLDAVSDRFHDLEVDADQIVAAHAGLARHAGGDDDHVGAGDIGVVVRALVLGIEPVDRRGFGDVETLALRNTFRDVEEHDVAEFLQADEMGERAADLAGADERDLVTGHRRSLRWKRDRIPREDGRCLTQKWGGHQAEQKVKAQGLEGLAFRRSAADAAIFQYFQRVGGKEMPFGPGNAKLQIPVTKSENCNWLLGCQRLPAVRARRMTRIVAASAGLENVGGMSASSADGDGIDEPIGRIGDEGKRPFPVARIELAGRDALVEHPLDQLAHPRPVLADDGRGVSVRVGNRHRRGAGRLARRSR